MSPRKSRQPEISEPPALEVVGLSKFYGDVAALEETDLEVPFGQSVVLVGHNGSGKSTLLSMAAGVLEPTGGEVLVHGEHNGTLSARRAVVAARQPRPLRRPEPVGARRVHQPDARRNR